MPQQQQTFGAVGGGVPQSGAPAAAAVSQDIMAQWQAYYAQVGYPGQQQQQQQQQR